MTPWETFLEAVGSVVSPDWSALVLLIPLAVALAAGAYLLWVVRRFATAGPRVARPLPQAPPPPGIHMPGPSLAPFLVAGGALAFLAALLFVRIEPATDPATGEPIPGTTTIAIETLGIVAMVVGVAALVGALLYWGREAMREYEALEGPAALPGAAPAALPGAAPAALPGAAPAAVPATVHEGPPPGVHIPGPSFRPLLASIATAVMLLGLVIHPAVFVAGLLMTVIGLLGWLNDARKEYVETVRADATGHLENIPAPRFPTGTLVVFAVLFVGSLLIAGGVFPPGGGAGGGSAVAPTPTAAPATEAPGTAGPTAAPGETPGETPGGGSGVVIKISAQNIAFDTDTLEVPAGTPFQIEFTNNDAGIPHNVAIHEGTPTGPEIWKGEIFNGVETRVYDVPALPAGTYGFICTVHPNMAGTLTAK
jgi:plastocyanin